MPAEGRTDPFASLSDAERERYGKPEDWTVEGYVGPRTPQGESAQFSLRIPKENFRRLRELARDRGMTFSELVRQALDDYVGATQPRLMNVVLRISSRDVGVIYPSAELTPDRTVYGVEQVPQRSEIDQPVTA